MKFLDFILYVPMINWNVEQWSICFVLYCIYSFIYGFVDAMIKDLTTKKQRIFGGKILLLIWLILFIYWIIKNGINLIN